jgi:hypothetical protein
MPNTRKLKNSHRERTCCGVVEDVRERRANRRNGQPWLVLKLMVGFTVGIMAYTAYVYIARLCVKMIHRRNGAEGSRSTGSESTSYLADEEMICVSNCERGKNFMQHLSHVLGSANCAGFGPFSCLTLFKFTVGTRQLISHASVALLSAFLVLYLWMLWAYIKVRASSPSWMYLLTSGAFRLY